MSHESHQQNLLGLKLRRLQDSPHGFEFKTSHHQFRPSVEKSCYGKQNIKAKEINFRELVQNEDRKYHTLKFKYNRNKSSQSSMEGMRNAHIEKILLSLPNSFVSQHRRTIIRKQWRRIIYAVIAVLRYRKIRYFNLLNLVNLAPRKGKTLITSPRSHSNPQARISQFQTRHKIGSFTQVVNQIGRNIQMAIELQALKKEQYHKSIYAQDQKLANSRIKRFLLLKPRTLSVQTQITKESQKKIETEIPRCRSVLRQFRIKKY